MREKLLLLSNSVNHGKGYLEHAASEINDFLGSEIKEVLFIPYAGVTMSYDDYTNRVAKPFGSIGYKLRGIHMFDDPVEAVKQASAVAVGGGNTFQLLSCLYKNNLLDEIRSKARQGMPVLGWSAGSNINGPSIRTTNDMPIVEPPSFRALNLVPFQINPHYTEATLPNHGGESRKQRIAEFLELNPDIYVVGIPEGALLRIENGNISTVGPGEIKIFRKGMETKIKKVGDDISFLLD
ncbi:dipeptidase PepE [Fulvivirgaceae bacterium BMA10]|uniref:Dipeptidase PepE n=1 Tax=Splendidivirga corallicola TaxID=3051826 RepID=A0ABT8KM10_9BACT|nr:dipeptidase PepE [Fulvivirgaceae bacterium BMA10]